MDQKVTSVLRRIGHTDALMQGHALSAQLVGIALISMLPGFGSQGVIISFFLMTLICGLLEVPTGYFADRFGWKKSLLLGAALTIISTCCMLIAVTIAVASAHWTIWFFIASEAVVDALALAFISGAYQAAYQSLYAKQLSELGISEKNASPLFLSSYRYGVSIRFGLPLFALILGFFIYSIYPQAVNDPLLRFIPVIPMIFVLFLTIVILGRIFSDLKDMTGEVLPLKINWREMFHIGASTHIPFLLHAYFRFSYLVIVVCVAGGIYHLLQDMGISDAYVWLSGMSFAFLMRLCVIFFGRFVYHRVANMSSFQIVTVASLLALSIGGVVSTLVLQSTLPSLNKVSVLFLFGVITLVFADLMARLIESKIQQFIPEIYRATWFSGSAVMSQLAFALIAGLSLLINVPYFSLGVLLATISAGGLCLLILVRGKASVDGLTPISLRNFLIGSGFIMLSIYSMVSSFLQTSEYTHTLGSKYDYVLLTKIKLKFISVMGTHALLFGAFLLLLICVSHLISLELKSVVTSGDGGAPAEPEQPLGIQEFSSLREQLHEHQKKLVEYEHARGMRDSAVKVAHDIRSPLSSLKAARTLLKEHVRNNVEANEALNLLQLSGNRLENIANDLLVQHQGKTSSGSGHFSIHEAIDELVGELKASSLGQGIHFDKAYHVSAIYMRGSKTLFSRAIGNIVKNALEAMHNANSARKQLMITTTLKPKKLNSSDQEICISVADTGPGIPEEKIPLILKGGHSEGKEGGHGIGTQVVRDMIETYGGQLAIDSSPDRGATVMIMVPNPYDMSLAEGSITIESPGPGGAVVIDDDAGLREQWGLTLKALGVHVQMFDSWEAFNGTGLKIPTGGETTFIVDYHFENSEIDGVEIIRMLKERGYTRCILATAEYWKPAIKEAALTLNAVLCPKPLPKIILKHVTESGSKVLLIDDDNGIRVSWKTMKQRWGVSDLQIFACLEDAIAAKINPSDFDLCVIDKNVDGSLYNGARMLAYLKENGARKVVLATGEQESAIRSDPSYDAIDGVLSSKVPETLSNLLPNS